MFQQEMFFFLVNRKVEDLQFRVEEACITKGDLEVNVQSRSTPVQLIYCIFYEFMSEKQIIDDCNNINQIANR